ncbi:hypothetical protein D3C77_462570 [compost metagenome]
MDLKPMDFICIREHLFLESIDAGMHRASLFTGVRVAKIAVNESKREQTYWGHGPFFAGCCLS